MSFTLTWIQTICIKAQCNTSSVITPQNGLDLMYDGLGIPACIATARAAAVGGFGAWSARRPPQQAWA